jgi:hypothetical protein
VIHYADDTLILTQGCPEQARLLHEILEAFSATRLSINLDKPTFVPTNLDEHEKTQISCILGCPVASFPQTYLTLDTPCPGWENRHFFNQGCNLGRVTHSNKVSTFCLAIPVSHASRLPNGSLWKLRSANMPTFGRAQSRHWSSLHGHMGHNM